jgi:flagellar biosynthetic protein FliQ
MKMSDIYLDLGQRGLITALTLATPLLGIALITGVTISIFQAITGIQEQTLIFIPKIVAIALVLLFLGPWMGQVIVGFATDLLSNMNFYIR